MKKQANKNEKTQITEEKTLLIDESQNKKNQNTSSTEIALSQENIKKVKKTKINKKKVAKVSKKKLPKIFKKKYSKKKFQKKLLSKIFILDDKKYVDSLFEEIKLGKKEKVFYQIPNDKLFTSVESKRLKVLAKQIKNQKGTIKFIPLFILITIVLGVFLFTDLILRLGLKSTFQSIFKAKTSIGYVHLDYADSSITLKNLVVANKDEPMKNLFQFDSIVFDIDINRLLEKNFVIDEIEASGFAMGTDRSTSGELPKKEKKVKEENQKDSKPKEPLIKPEYFESLKTKVTSELQKMFGNFDPNTILASAYNSLQTPTVSEAIMKEVNTLISYWKEKPNEISQDVKSFLDKANTLSSLDFSNIKDIKSIQNNLESISNTIKLGENLTSEFKTTYDKLDSDFAKVTKFSSNIEKAIQADTKLASNITSNIKSFTPQNGMRLLSSSLEDLLSKILGNAYPLIDEGYEKVKEIMNKLPKKEKATKKEEKKIERLAGTNFTWGRKEMPEFYVGIAHASGSGFDVTANNLSNNPTLINAPLTVDGTYSIAGRQDSFNATLDLRDSRATPMLVASYHAPEIPADFDFIKSNSTLDVQFSADEDKSISIAGNAYLKETSLTLPTFEPKLAYDVCTQALNNIDSTYLGLMAGITGNGNLKLNVNTDFDNQFIKEVSSIVNAKLVQLKDEATKSISKKLEEYSTPVKEKVAEFNEYKQKLENSKKELENKIAELKNKFEEESKKLIQQKKEEAENAIQDTVNKYVDTSAIDSIKKWF